MSKQGKKKIKRILITGSRNWDDKSQIADVLRPLFTENPNAILVHGGANGADKLSAQIWGSWGGKTEAHLADWNEHGRAAGPIRNQKMVNLGADICLAFPLGESRGTYHCVSAATKAGIPVRVVGEDLN